MKHVTLAYMIWNSHGYLSGKGLYSSTLGKFNAHVDKVTQQAMNYAIRSFTALKDVDYDEQLILVQIRCYNYSELCTPAIE